jgi:hypothetical protein
MNRGRSLAGSLPASFPGMVAAVVLHVAPVASVAAPPETIPLSVSDVQLVESGRAVVMTYTLHNNGPDRLVAWSLEFEFLYPDGYRANQGFTMHCHLVATEQSGQECEVSPGDYKEGRPLRVSSRNGQLPSLRAARFRAAVFETPGTSVEKWLGDREAIDALAHAEARRRLAWQELLRVLEGTVKEHGLTRTAARMAHEQLDGGGASNDTVREAVRDQLTQLLQRGSQGDAAEADAIAALLRTARRGSAPLLWLESHRAR